MLGFRPAAGRAGHGPDGPLPDGVAASAIPVGVATGAAVEGRGRLRAFAPTAAAPETGLTPGELAELAHPVIDSAGLFESLSVPAGDLVANGRVAKFLVDLRNPGQPRVLFINGRFQRNGRTPLAAKYHHEFAKAVLQIPEAIEEFNRVTYFSPTKRYAAGVLHTYLRQGSSEPVYGMQFYPQDVLAEQTVLDVVSLVALQVTIPGAALAFVATGQQQTVATVRDQLAAAGIAALTIEEILGDITYLPLNTGEAWGYLRIFPKNRTLTPADIPVFDELPLDLSVVAGVITRAVQDSNSHVNLKSKERGTPNMVLRDASPANTRLAPWADQPVHFVVRSDDFLLEAGTAQEIQRRLDDRNKRPWIPLRWDTESAVRSYDEMAAGSASQALAFSSRYGGKAANLGFLAHRSVLGRAADPRSVSGRRGYDLVPGGFGIPLSYYRNLVEHPNNTELRAALDQLIADEKAGVLTPEQRGTRSYEVQTLFLNATIPPADLAAVKAALQRVLPGVNKVKIRSSANAEDVPNFDGAGLHDSFAATVGKKDNPDGSCAFDLTGDPGGEVKRKVSPKSVACAIKGVYASLWNQRAIEERSNARIDHATVAMGLSVVPSYDAESDIDANAVVVTRVLNAAGIYGYSLSIQDGNNLVTNPDLGTQTESTIAAFGTGDEPTSFTVVRFAKPVADGPTRTEPVLERSQMLELVDIARTVELAYCPAKPGYYGGDCRDVPLDDTKPTSLDLELKLLQDGRFVCKQVREFGGR